MIEVIVASSLFLSTIAIFVPILSQLQIEKNILNERRTAAIELHEELQQYIWEKEPTLPAAYITNLSGSSLRFQFTKRDELIKGCVEWQNAKQNKEILCLYAHSNIE